MSTWDCGNAQIPSPKINEKLNTAAQHCLSDISTAANCKIVAAGFIGSRMIGIYNETSDYDIRAIADVEMPTGGPIAKSYEYASYKIDIKVYPFSQIVSEINEWRLVDKYYPSLHSIPENPLVHSDVVRSQFRQVLQNPIYVDNSFFKKNKEAIREGLLVCDQLDYDYIRAYSNYYNFLQKGSVNLRKYLYTLYEILSIKWVLEKNTFCPDFLAGQEVYPFPAEIAEIVTKLMELNRRGLTKEKSFVEKNAQLNEYIGGTLNYLKERIGISCEECKCKNYLRIQCIKGVLEM